MLIFRLIILSLWLTAAGAAMASDASTARPAEYMIYQYPGVNLVVKVDAAEVEFESKIYGPEQALLKSSGVPARRVGPIYQFIDAVETPRQLMVRVSPAERIDRARVSLELIQLSGRDRNNLDYARAYQLFSLGTETVHSDDSATWSSKAHTLMNAANAFAALGWEEMRLWAGYYAAHLVLHRLDDRLTALELARETGWAAERAGLEQIVMASLLLESEALLMLRDGTQATGRFGRIHKVLASLAARSGALGLHSEQARALFNDGQVWEQQGRLEQAIGQYENALEIALSAGHTSLADEIRAVAALAYEAEGRTAQAIDLLADAGTDQQGRAVADVPDDLVRSLFERGRILNDNYRFEEARADLTRALELQQSQEGAAWGPTGLALARAQYALGELEPAARLIAESAPRTSAASHRVELAEAYGWLANIRRHEGRFREMERHRDRQDRMLRSDTRRAGLYLERGLDALAQDGAASPGAERNFARSQELAVRAGDSLAEQRAVLHRCLSRIVRASSGGCDRQAADRAHRALANSAIPRLAVEADFIRAQILRREGSLLPAIDGMRSLIDDLGFLRQSLPGVLGAWYWQNRTAVFREFMAATLAGGSAPADGEGSAALLALERIRQQVSLDRIDAPASRPPASQDEFLRAQLALRDTDRSANAEAASGRLSAQIAELRSRFRSPVQPVDADRLSDLLGGLSGSESVLSYYLDAPTAIALVARRDGVRLVRLRAAEELPAMIRDTRLAVGQDDADAIALLDRLGRQLLEPLAEQLTQQVYLLPSGPLDGFPLDLLRVGGHFLAQRAQTVNLLSLAALEHRGQALSPDFAAGVFLAGSPQATQDPFSYDVQVSAEISAVRDRFVGPGLHIVQGVALSRDEFQDERLTNAGLIHLAMPGILDLARPQRSRLRLSAGTGAGRDSDLSPRDVRAQHYRAELVTLSNTAVTGTGGSPFDSGLGFVTDFLESGARRVLVALWPLGEEEVSRFTAAFYDSLADSADVAEALRVTRQARMGQKNEPNFRSWAGFQLHIR